MDGVEGKKLKFRIFLKTEISDHLSGENVKSLKQLCLDFVPGEKNETIQTGIDLFGFLIELDLINYQKVQFLCELLDAIGRVDLKKEVTDYAARVDLPTPVVPDGTRLDHVTLEAIAKAVGRDWKMFARRLGLDEAVIQSIHQANFGDLHEASLQALLRWKKDEGDAATPRVLKAVLTDMRLMSIVHKYFDGVV